MRAAGAGRARQNRRFVLDQLQPAIERAAADHLEGDFGVAVVDSLATAAPRDDREYDHAKAVDETGTQESAAQRQASDRPHGRGARLLQLPDGLDRIAVDELRVRPRKRLPQDGRKDDLREVGEDVFPGSPSVASSDMSR